MTHTLAQDEMVQKIKIMGPGNHLCFLYETEKEHRILLASFIRQGLEQGERVLYIVDSHTIEEVLNYLSDDGLPVQSYLKGEQLGMLNAYEAYAKEATFHPDGMISFLRDQVKRTMDEGYSALRITGEMSWALKGIPGSKRLIEYEAMLNEFLPGSKCLAICQYDRRRFNSALLLDVLATHPTVALGGDVFNNFYYIPPEDLLGSDPFTAKLNNWLASLMEQKEAEEKILLANERLQYLLSATSAVIYTARASGDYDVTFISDNIFQMVGYEPREFYENSKFWSHHVHPEDRPRILTEVLILFENGLHTFEYRFRCRDGSYIWVRDELKLIRNKDGDILETVGYLVDINERKQWEEALQESEERFRSLAENAPDIIFTLNQQGAWTYVNPAFHKILGYSGDEMIGKYATDIIREEHVENQVRFFKRVRDEKETIKDESITLIHQDGSDRLFNVSTSCHVDLQGNINGIVGLLKDITEHRRLETQLQQSQKMEAIGTLAGGIAHDFNNILMGIQGHASLMLMETNPSQTHLEHLKGIESYVQSAADLSRQLLGFAKGGNYEVKPTDLNEVIKSQNRMFGRTKKEITIRGNYEEPLWPVEVDQGQIAQVLLNLYVNASQAMPGGGSLHVQTENIVLDEGYIKPFELEPGRYVKISVIDKGVGMDEATKQRIFDPFFTTKEMGRGTGLGLASVYGIIKNHAGIINVYSEKGFGTTFNIYLPSSEKKPVEKKKVQLDFLMGEETILLVDDEDLIIDVGERLLKRMGYKVLLARGGREAINVYEKNKDKIDLVILDMIMPEMGGAETYSRMKEISPDIRVLLSSGYAENGLATEILDRGCDGFIQKPFNIGQLSQKIRDILDNVQ